MDKRTDRPGPSRSSYNEDNFRDFCCMICRGNHTTKSVLRLIFKERIQQMLLVILRLIITNGIITERSKKNISFFKLRHDEQSLYPFDKQTSDSNAIECLDSVEIEETRPSFCTKHQRTSSRMCRKQRSYRVETHPNKEGELIAFCLARLAEKLCLSVHSLNQVVDSIITTYCTILVDLNLSRLRKMSGKRPQTIEDIIFNIFWQARTSGLIYSQSDRGQRSWFESVDRDFVLPFISSSFHRFNSGIEVDESILLMCTHVIERSTTDLLSWYVQPYFYHGDTYSRPNTYAEFLHHLHYGNIKNPFVTVIDANPLLLYANFAHVVSSNFYSHHRYIREYMRDIGLLTYPTCQIQNIAPFVVRSLNPDTRMHIFHMVYKNKTYDTASYENVYKVLILLRDAMIRLHLRHVAMPKIGSKYDNLDFQKVLKMIEYVFRKTNIRITAGTNRKSWWRTHCGRMSCSC
ncbi:hypothetical protein KM043_000682 [Ampulex compressa]|nr:hypothetical protein KM043_000682 [Ampulex compressa]